MAMKSWFWSAIGIANASVVGCSTTIVQPRASDQKRAIASCSGDSSTAAR